jgi:uncharacterized protein (TIGR03790 family)
MRRRMARLAAMLAGVVLARGAWGLEAGEVAVVFNTKSAASLQIARYYLNARHLPQDHLIPLTCEVGETISESQYRTSVVPQIKKALEERKLAPDATGKGGIRCLVTTYDVPLRIGAKELTADEKAEVAGYEKRLEGIAEELGEAVKRLDAVGKEAGTRMPAGSVGGVATQPTGSAGAGTRQREGSAGTTRGGSRASTGTALGSVPKPTWREALAKAQGAGQEAAGRLARLGEAERITASREFLAVEEKVGGVALVMTLPAATADVPTLGEARQKVAAMAAAVREGQGQVAALMPQRDSARMRREIVIQRGKIEGLTGEAAALEEMIRYVRPLDTAACFDGELALVLADQSYPRERWVVNPKWVEAYPAAQRAAAGREGQAMTTLMVCRLDGATPAKVEAMIDTGLKVEAKGLKGKIYIDARGLPATDAYGVFDDDLRKAADWLKKHGTMEVVLENTGALLAAKDAPEAAVYVGWYSVGNYQESGQWVKGAVGYHVASFEMMSLHNAGEKGWVVNLLNRGFCGTLGPTDEPYLNSFPKASQFVPLLLCGEFTQGEVWEVTNPMLSWREGFVGDPLYNPFKAGAGVRVEEVRGDAVLRRAWEVEGRK